MSPITLSQLNALDRPGFVAALAGIFEGSPWIVEETWARRPFPSVAALYDALAATMLAAPIEKQLALIRAHPDLVGRAALAGTLTPASTAEQAAAGLDVLSSGEIAAFTRLNDDYKRRFDFPFVICARDHRKASILAGFEARLGNAREEEITTALGEVGKIARLRLRDTVTE
ncbi:MAG TPA: 2-oxo-4-hydroxy-4-carboxy-5-ureidoimidazoline decarboxylase [Ktedonobacterales bacterium]